MPKSDVGSVLKHKDIDNIRETQRSRIVYFTRTVVQVQSKPLQQLVLAKLLSNNNQRERELSLIHI